MDLLPEIFVVRQRNRNNKFPSTNILYQGSWSNNFLTFPIYLPSLHPSFLRLLSFLDPSLQLWHTVLHVPVLAVYMSKILWHFHYLIGSTHYINTQGFLCSCCDAVYSCSLLVCHAFSTCPECTFVFVYIRMVGAKYSYTGISTNTQCMYIIFEVKNVFVCRGFRTIVH